MCIFILKVIINVYSFQLCPRRQVVISILKLKWTNKLIS